MTHVTCRLTAKNRNQLRNPVLGIRVWATCFNEQTNGKHRQTDPAWNQRKRRSIEEYGVGGSIRQRWAHQVCGTTLDSDDKD